VVGTRHSLTPIDFAGLHIFDYTAGDDLGSSLAVIEVPAGASHAEAWSERSDKYYLTIAGAIQFELEGRVYRLGPGDFCLVRKGRRFAYSNPTNDLATLVLVHTPNFQFGSERFAAPEQQQPSNESAA
jgi:mannose-6-phosphate isomerase-like protein (cupin superfamily)